MDAFYTEIRLVHVGAVLTSGMLFFLRGMAVSLFDAAWPHRAPVRYLTYTVDTVLLLAAVLLTMAVHQYPLSDNWLTMKLVLLAVYIGLGTVAIKRGKTKTIRLWAWVAALAVFGFIASVAHTRNPLGLIAML